MTHNNSFVLITKDAMCRDYLPCYGGVYWAGKTPNIDELVSQGTQFLHHYTAAGSTVMSFYSMCTGRFAHETDYQLYEKYNLLVEGETIFTKVKGMGFEECHIIWDDMWDVLPHYFNYFRDDVTIHSLKKFRQGVGPHYIHDGKLKSDKEKENQAFNMVENEVKKILETGKRVFLWIHFPHVIYGRVSYGSDIDLFDKYVGMFRRYFSDNCIAISSDHGNMNGHKGKLGYGFDVEDTVSRIPFITPKIGDYSVYESNTSSVDLFDILFKKHIPIREFVYCDTAYRAQPHRKLAIIYQHYKYVFEKNGKRELLYDLQHDPNEEFSLMADSMFDVDRKLMYPIREEFFYDNWDEIEAIRKKLSDEKERIWREGSKKIIVYSNIKNFVRPLYKKLTRVKQ